MKLSKKTRFVVYSILQKEVEDCRDDNSECFMCLILAEITNIPSVYFSNELRETFPELFYYEPTKTHNSGGWFSEKNYNSRIKILNKCIEKTS